jgi:serine/threonine protein kinase
MGVVYRTRQRGLDRMVALKMLPPEAGLDPTFAERFAREARALARLNHPGIVTVYDFGQADGVYYFLMEYVDGTNLRDVIRRGRLKPEEAVTLVPQICEALQYAHEEGVVHRDIKPENILLDRRGRVKIADFGLAKLLVPAQANDTLTDTRQVMGTPHYMAPEQWDNRCIPTPRSGARLRLPHPSPRTPRRRPSPMKPSEEQPTGSAETTAASLFDQHRTQIFCQSDRLFAGTMVFEWVAGVVTVPTV